MARKPTKRITEIIPADDDERGDTRERFDFDPAEESFSQFRNKFGSEGVTVKIYRRTPRGTQYCFSGLPSEIDEEVVRLYHSKQPYAGEEGQYAARCFVNGEARDSFPILIGPQVAMPGSVDGGGMAVHGAGQQSDVVRLLLAQNERLEARLSQMGAVEREPLSSLADALLKLNSLQAKSELPLDSIIKAVELGRSLGGESGDSWRGLIGDAIREAKPLIGELIAARRNGGGMGGGGVVENSGSPQDETVALKQAFSFLKRKCLSGSDPGLYIDIILDNRDDASYQRLIHAVLTREFSEFAAIDREIEQPPFAAFFRFIYDGLRQAADESNKLAEDTGRESGDAKNVAGHVEPRKAGGKKP